MKIKFLALFQLILLTTIVACDPPTPAEFWKEYETNLLLKNVNDQGPYGGHRSMYWKSKRAYFFDSKNTLDFAKKNGWTLVDSLTFTREQADKWKYLGKPVFPLTHKGFSDTSLQNATLEDFPRWFGGNLTVYRFRTGWVTIDPGTTSSIEENGFILINDDKRELAVYHLWGE